LLQLPSKRRVTYPLQLQTSSVHHAPCSTNTTVVSS
jgi:hypothetical protein